MQGQCCGSCNAFMPIEDQKGVCRARPPVPILVGLGQRALALASQQQAVPIVEAHFPTMFMNGWCREWQPSRLQDEVLS